jgi:Uma2 family endonuclease
MSAVAASSRPFVPGTTGWTAHDLEDPQIEQLWFQGRYEIIDGVLTSMAPAYFPGTQSLQELIYILKTELKRKRIANHFGAEVDVHIDEDRVVRADAVWLTPEEQGRQREATARAGRADPGRTRILIPPKLVIESISVGHERHDEITKRRWYAEFGIPNYWILNPFAKSLKCFVLDGGSYRVDAEGRNTEEIRTTLFPELTIELGTLWLEM